MPNFAVVFAAAPFGAACGDPELNINLLMLVHGEQELEFFEPIKPNDTMKTVGTISEIYAKGDKAFLIVTSQTTNQRNELVVKGKWTAVIR